MNAIVTIEQDATGLSLPDALPFEEWCELGRTLLTNQRRANWMVADWAHFGLEHFQHQFGFMAEQVGMDAGRLTKMAKVAQAFPESQRAASLSFEVHYECARVEPEQRLLMLNEAQKGKWSQKTAHERVEEKRLACGARMNNDDPEYAQMAEVVRAYNRLFGPDVREQLWPYLEYSARNGFCPINLEVTIDA